MIGAVLGFVIFLAVGALPVLAFSANMGHMLAAVVLGSPVDPGILYDLFVGFSIVVGIIAIASLFVTVGSVLGIFVGAVVSHVRFGRKSDDEPLIVIEHDDR
jgi:hypothetical protein